jgi:hypothetical protein
LEKEPLQDILIEKHEEDHPVTTLKGSVSNPPPQDLLLSQHAVLIGLIAYFTDTALQDHIAMNLERLQQLGFHILNHPPQSKGESHDPEAPDPSTPASKRSQPSSAGSITDQPSTCRRFIYLEFGPSQTMEHFYREIETKHINPAHHIQKIVALSEIYGAEPVARAIEDAFFLHAFSCEYIANLLEQPDLDVYQKRIL